VCDEGNRVRVTIASVNPDNMAYREFIWSHEDWPDGCGMIPGDRPVFAEHNEWVKALVPLRLAIGDPGNWLADSDFSGDVVFHGYGADQYLVHQVGGVLYPLFRIGMAGTWEDDACNKKIQWVQGDLRPLGKVQCGAPPLHAPGKCSFKPPEACNTKHKQSASKRFNGAMISGSLPIDKLPWWLKPFIKIGVAVAGVELATKDSGLDPPLARKFVFVGGSFSGAGSGLDRFKGAIAPEQDADKPSQLVTGDPDHWYSRSDFDRLVLGELEFFGGSRKIELTTDAGTFKFNNFGCNAESRKYYGAFQPVWHLECPGKVDLEPFEEEECKDDEKCPEKVRLAGHTKFKAKIGRATLASLPSLGRRAAEKFGCHFSAAFVNIQSEDGPEEKQIHREFIVLLENSGCEFNVDKGESTFHALPGHKLATEKPEDIFAGSDFVPAAWLTAGGTLTIIPDTNVPVWFDLPGKYDPACKGTKRAIGLVLPVAAVDCGKAPDPIHDTATTPSHADACNDFKRRNSWVNNVLLDLHDGKYDDVLNGLNSGQLMIPSFVYYDYLGKPGTVQTNALFVGKAPNPSGGPPIRVVAFADIRVVNVYPSMAMDIEFLTDLCAFDETGNVILVHPDGCMEGVGRKGQTLPVDPKALPKQKKGSGNTDLHTA